MPQHASITSTCTIKPALAAGTWVVCDRFHDSTRAYQGGARLARCGLSSRRLERVTLAGTKPDLTLILDLPAKTWAHPRRDAPGGRCRTGPF